MGFCEEKEGEHGMRIVWGGQPSFYVDYGCDCEAHLGDFESEVRIS